MNFIANYDQASSSDEEKLVESSNESSRPSWLNDNKNSDDEENEISSPVNSIIEENRSGLISANELFAKVTTGPEFLISRNETAELAAISTKKYSPAVISKNPVPSHSLQHASEVKILKDVEDNLKKKKDTHVNKKKLLEEKSTAKDRVKRQRLQGQSGIGADFKEWRSEEEMRQRQQFDS